MTRPASGRHLWRVMAALFAALMLLGACGSDGDSAESDNASGEDDGATDESNGGDNGSGGSPSASDVLSDSDCRELILAAANFQSVDPTDFTNLDTVVEQYRAFADAAPSEIRDDLRLFTDAFEGYLQALSDIGFDPSDPSSATALNQDSLAALEAASQEFDSEEVMAAIERVEQFVESNCGE